MAENKFFPDSFNPAEEWRRLEGEDVMWGQIIPHSLPPPPTSVFQEQAECKFYFICLHPLLKCSF